MAAVARQILHPSFNQSRASSPSQPKKRAAVQFPSHGGAAKLRRGLSIKAAAPERQRASPSDDAITQTDGIVGVSLGTLKLPPDTDVDRLETLLFQWANSLSQGANMPLPVPLKVDKVQGGARLGFIKVENGKAEVFAYIDCLVYPAEESSGWAGPVFRATRHGPLRDKIPPGEERIMTSLLQALRKSLDILRV